MPDLEYLCTSYPIGSLSSTRLHTLKLDRNISIDKALFPKMASLTHLGPIVVGGKSEHDTDYLSVLTNLASFAVIGGQLQDEAKSSILGSLNTSKLIHLQISGGGIDLGYLTNLTTIQTLNVASTHILKDEISGLTNLTNLGIESSVGNELANFTKLRELYYCPQNVPQPDRNISLAPLTNLESLRVCIKIVAPNLQNLTNLTHLEVVGEYGTFHNLPFLAKLVNLRSFTCNFPSDCGQYFSVMSNLQCLRVYCINSEQELKALTSLTNLVCLQQEDKLTQLSLLTNLIEVEQYCRTFSKKPKKVKKLQHP